MANLDAMRWLELDWDIGPVSQYGRADRHREALERLLASGHAYRDHATAKDVEAWKAEHGTGQGYRGTPTDDPSAAIRLRVPDAGETVVDDLLDLRKGEDEFDLRLPFQIVAQGVVVRHGVYFPRYFFSSARSPSRRSGRAMP